MPSFFQRPRQGTVIASATDVSPGNENAIKRAAMTSQTWQSAAWRMYDKLAEIHYPANYIGSALGRFLFPVGVVPEDNLGGDPAVPTGGGRTALYGAAEEAMFRLEGDLGGASEIARLYALNMVIAADGWLAGEDRSDGTNWEFLSVEELKATPDGTYQRFSVKNGGTPDAYEPSYVKRFWRAHPARSQIADSAMVSLIDDCERLITLNESMKARLISRLSQAGIMFIPSELEIVSAVDAPTGDGQKVQDPFMVAMFGAMEKAMTSGSPNRALPMMVRGPGANGKEIAFITMDRSIDRVEMELRSELRNNIAAGIDLPPETQQGMGQATHFQSWGIGDATYSAHLLPEAQRYADGITRTYLWPALREWNKEVNNGAATEHDIRRHVVLPDGTQVVTRPNAAEDLRQVRDRLAVSNAALRKGAGIDEIDAPDDDEYVRQMGVRANNPYLAVHGLKVQDEIDWEKAGAVPSGDGAPGAGGTPPTRRPADSSDTPDPPEDGKAADHAAQVFAAAAAGHLLAAQKTVGARVRALAEPHPEIHAAVKRYPNERVLSALDEWEDLGLDDGKVAAMYVDALSGLAETLHEIHQSSAPWMFVGLVAELATAQQHSPITFSQLHRIALDVLSTSET